MKSKILLVDDHPVVREGLALMLDREPDLMVCGVADDAHSALRAIACSQPDVVVVDISLNGPSGMELLGCIRRSDTRIRVLVLSMHDEKAYAERCLRAGAHGYIMKQEATEKVLAALRLIISGEIYVSERIASRMLERISGSPPGAFSPLDDLTDREMEVFRLIGEGLGTKQIAGQLHLSVKTVETYQAHIKEKMALKNARELTQCAIQWAFSQTRPSSVH